MLMKIAAVTAAVPALFVATLASLDWMVVDVREGGPAGHRIVVPVPLVLARAAVEFAPDPDLDGHAAELREAAPIARAVLQAISDAPDAELVRVEDRGETVSIRKEGDQIRIAVDARDGEQVRVNLPLRAARVALDGLASGHVRTADLVAALDAVEGDLVDVRSGEDHVRVWVW